ncbi:DUF2474 domain-containing protein [Rhizobium brockwellii]
MSARRIARLSKQVLWMGLIWVLSVFVLAVFAGVLRIFMSAAGMTS